MNRQMLDQYRNSLIEESAYVEIDKEETIKNLLHNYEIIDDYETNLQGRINNFRFIDVLKALIEIEKPSDDFSIDNLDSIYKHEYLEIINSLQIIDDKMKKIAIFNECKFINIPVNHHIKYPNQIMTLLFQLHKSFTELNNYREQLNKQYSFKDIKNYAMFKNTINNIQGFEIDNIPNSWKTDNLEHFKRAVELYPEVKRNVYAIQERELYLDWDYHNLGDFNVNKAIEDILGPYFTLNDVDKINNIIDNITSISSKLYIGKYSSDIYIDNLARVKNILDWQFRDDDDGAIDFIIKAIYYLNNNYVSNKWLDKKQYKSLKKQINNLKKQFEEYTKLIQEIKSFFN